MAAPSPTRRRLFRLGLMALVGGVVGLLVGSTGVLSPRDLTGVREYPLPHHVPRHRGDVTLRFAMVHDVLHERFARHGPAYYGERNRQVRAALTVLGKELRGGEKPPETYFALLDDLGVGLDALREDDEAVTVMRDKLRQQEQLGRRGRDLYTTYANLGTFLIHGSFRRAQEGEEAAKGRLREGLGFIHKAIEVNPEAHFGRETWQAVAVEYLLAALDAPRLLLQYDLVGDRLDQAVDPATRDYCDRPRWGGVPHQQARHVLAGLGPEDSSDVGVAAGLRESIARIGAEEGWQEAVQTSHREPVPFDEPVLGILGMWRLGGGANPHFALALGEIMMRVGQRYIAWCAYERAAGMADRFWPEPALQQQLVDHCRKRQAVIERELPRTEGVKLRPAFEAELAYGRQYQDAYQGYEAEQIAAGTSLDDPHFYDAFHAAREPIASPVGGADKFLATPGLLPPLYFSPPAMILFAGLVTFTTAWVLRVGHSLPSAPPDFSDPGGWRPRR